MTGVIVNNRRAALERVIVEFRVMAIETVKLHDMAGLTLRVGNFVQLEAAAP